MGIQRSRKKFNPKSTRHWHRYLGVFAALFVVLLSITGIMLNHTEELALDSKYVESETMLSLYGIGLPSDPISFFAQNSWITQIGRKIYLNENYVSDMDGSLIGAVYCEGFLVISLENALLLITEEGQIIEKLGPEVGVPENLFKIGFNNKDEIVVENKEGTFASDKEFVTWQPLEPNTVTWSTVQKLPDNIYQHLLKSYRGKGLPLERVILDLHSGRILGTWGVYVFDGFAVILIILSFSGIYMYFFPAGMKKRRSSN